MSEIVDLVAIAERRKLQSRSSPAVDCAGQKFTSDAQMALDDIKLAIAKAIVNPAMTRQIEDADVPRSFIRTLHGTLRSGRQRRHFLTQSTISL